MAYFTGRTLKRNLEKRFELVVILKTLSDDFQPKLGINYLEYEDVGCLDNRVLALSLSNYNRRSNKREFIAWILIPLCLTKEFAICLKKYNTTLDGEKELGCLQENPSLNQRILVFQQGKNIRLVRQVLRCNIWGHRFGITITKEQLPAFINFFKHFCVSHIEEIKQSYARRTRKMYEWSGKVSR